MLHYWFIESEGNPASDPVLLWLNGGPGSSSLVGLLTENGQLQTNDDSINNKSGNITLIYNPYSWSQHANVLYLEQPKGVGFSYCTQGTECVNTDESVGTEAADFLERWFAAFSEYKSNDFYITGESYAGIYIPEIMQELDKRGTLPNLKGAAIGDGCWGNDVGTCSFESYMADRISVEFYYGHGMLPQTLYPRLKAACKNFTGPESAECHALLAEMDASIGSFDIYQVYDTCGTDQVTQLTHRDIYRILREARTVNTTGNQVYRTHPQLTGALNDYTCGAEKVMEQWLAQPEVQTALHVSRRGSQSYRRTAADLRPVYKDLAQKYRMLIYSGNVDACVPYWGSEEWTRELGFELKQAWRPWHSGSRDEPNQKNILAGYVTTYTAGSQEFTFLTVHGAGHLVPQHKPVQALTMLTRFLNNEAF
jgi:carboxypeptidase C (cathepsin A)